MAELVKKVGDIHNVVCDPAQRPEERTRRTEEHQAIVRELNEKLLREKDKTKTLKERSRQFEKSFDNVCRELQVKEKELEDAQAVAHTLQLHAINQAQSGWKVEDDSKVRDVLESFYLRIRQWAQRYNVRSMGEVEEKYNMGFECLIHDLEGIAKFPSIEALKGMECPFLLVAAMLSRELMSHIFGKSFYLLSSIEQPRKTLQYGQNLEIIHQKLCQG